MRKTPSLLITVPLCLLLIAYFRARLTYYRDPTSIFFDRFRAYDRKYSGTRQTEARAFIESAASQPSRRSAAASRPLFCVGIPVNNRSDGYLYIRDTIGSLLAGLAQSERDAIHLMPFIAQSDPHQRPIYNEPWLYNESWLHNVADQILTYNALDTLRHVDVNHIKQLEGDPEDTEKQVFDYAYMLGACHQVNASYIVAFEDDVLALDGWFHRTKAALEAVEQQVQKLVLAEFFYLRLFYTEQNLGWNSEFWFYYLSYSFMATIAALSTVLYYLRRQGIKRYNNQILGLTIFYCAIAIGLFFANGRVSMLSQPYGVKQMPRYGCCAQGMVYNPAWVPRLTDYLKVRMSGNVHSIIEDLGNTNEVGSRWALTPSVVQHAGTSDTAKEEEDADDRGEASLSQQIWNFAFELNNAKVLRKEHKRAVERQKS